MWRLVLGSFAALMILLAGAAYVVLVPAESVRPPPTSVIEPNLVEIPAPFAHRWSKTTSHPLLAAAAIAIDGSGRDAVFLGGSDGQPDGLLAWRDGKLVDLAADVGLGDTEATYGALSIDIDGDGHAPPGAETVAKLTLPLDHSMGADQKSMTRFGSALQMQQFQRGQVVSTRTCMTVMTCTRSSSLLKNPSP